MKSIIVTKHAGFCPGVRRAISLAHDAVSRAGEHKVYTLGPLINNPVVIDRLSRAGISVVTDPEEASGEILVIRAHGVTPEVLKRAKEHCHVVVDATCPFVARAQEQAAKFASESLPVIVVGDKEHPEVLGIVGNCKEAVVIEEPEQVRALELPNEAGLVAQTTYDQRKLQLVVEELQRKGVRLHLANTICEATRLRQDEVRELASQCDLMLVIGGASSANTRRLVEIAREAGCTTYLVEGPSEIRAEWLEGRRAICIAAGASTPDDVIKEVTGKVEEITGQSPNPSQEEKREEEAEKKIYDEALKPLNEGDIVEGKVVSVDDNGALVDIGYKSEGIVPPGELSKKNLRPQDVVKPGDVIQVVVLGLDKNQEGTIRLSKRRADELLAWDRLEKAKQDGSIIEAEAVQSVKGGLVVDVGVRGFVPASQVERGYVSDLTKYVGTTLRMKVLEVDKARNRVVLSQRVVLEEEREKKKQETWASLEEGQVRHGVVKGITDFGVFVDIGGVDGLLHISELSWGRVNHPSEVVKEGQELDVKVLRVDREKGRISLGLKQILPDPWTTVESKYSEGSTIEGKVTRLAPFGAFVELEPGVEGLVHISEMSDERVAKPEDVVCAGQTVRVKVLRVRPAEKRISLSIKQADQGINTGIPGAEEAAASNDEEA
ncbi:MAG TPA: bifunctional 4-hydroxy-3-methylbut-2-enyl diphosphate reductase/30S ribosomal protein S1 [Firmicutes bacterium]|nr:bifunctional 4-hydroxy-3-methylbut-2-enyl diphosphate reductase/30S ribosomal protein S1 [Bacillota bacterium]